MREEIIKKLNQEFARELVKNRKGPAGRQFDYIETHAVIARLNEALGMDWSFEVVEHRVLDNEVLVLGKLTVHAEPIVSKAAFGAQVIKRYEQTKEIISLGDDLKAAASDALKKAATLLGVGLHLYGRNVPGSANRANGHQANGTVNNGHGSNGKRRFVGNRRDPWLRAPGASGMNGNSNGWVRAAKNNDVVSRGPNSPLSPAQMKAIFRIGNGAGHSYQSIKAMVKARFGKEVIDHLTKQEASHLIDALKQKSNPQ